MTLFFKSVCGEKHVMLKCLFSNIQRHGSIPKTLYTSVILYPVMRTLLNSTYKHTLLNECIFIPLIEDVLSLCQVY